MDVDSDSSSSSSDSSEEEMDVLKKQEMEKKIEALETKVN